MENDDELASEIKHCLERIVMAVLTYEVGSIGLYEQLSAIRERLDALENHQLGERNNA